MIEATSLHIVAGGKAFLRMRRQETKAACKPDFLNLSSNHEVISQTLYFNYCLLHLADAWAVGFIL